MLSLYAFGVALGIPAGTAYKATGRAGVLLALAIPRAALVVASIAVVVDRGIVAVAWCQATVAGLFAVIGLAIASRMLGVGAARLASALLPALVPAVGMGALQVAVVATIASPWAALAVGVPAGAAAYAGLLALVAPGVVRDARRRVSDARRPSVAG